MSEVPQLDGNLETVLVGITSEHNVADIDLDFLRIAIAQHRQGGGVPAQRGGQETGVPVPPKVARRPGRAAVIAVGWLGVRRGCRDPHSKRCGHVPLALVAVAGMRKVLRADLNFHQDAS